MAPRTLLEVQPLTSTTAAEVVGVDLRAIDGEQCTELRTALSVWGVLVFRDQGLSRDEQVTLAARFGAPHGHPVKELLLARPDDPIAVVENDADRPAQDGQDFHTDYSFNTVVPDLAILRPEVLPSNGGDTMWSSTRAAYAGLSAPVQAFVAGLSALHDPGERFWFEYERALGVDVVRPARQAFPGVAHPVVSAHPITGEPLLFVNRGYTTRVTGVTPRESRWLLDLLFDQLNDPAFHYRHKWRPGDVVMWDEHATVHMGPHDFHPEHRRLTRVTAGRGAPRPYGGPAPA
jgi:taurine dioxygenase